MDSNLTNNPNNPNNNPNNNVDSKLSAARDGVAQINKDLRADAHTAIDKVADKVPPATDRLATRAHNGVDAVADTVDSVSTGVVARGKQLGAAYKQFADTGRDYVRTSPAISVLLAAAAGYGLSKLLSSRK
jgi:ElaB protein